MMFDILHELEYCDNKIKDLNVLMVELGLNIWIILNIEIKNAPPPLPNSVIVQQSDQDHSCVTIHKVV